MPDQEEMHGLNPMAMHYTSHIQDFHNSIDFNGHQHDFHHLAFKLPKTSLFHSDDNIWREKETKYEISFIYYLSWSAPLPQLSSNHRRYVYSPLRVVFTWLNPGRWTAAYKLIHPQQRGKSRSPWWCFTLCFEAALVRHKKSRRTKPRTASTADMLYQG